MRKLPGLGERHVPQCAVASDAMQEIRVYGMISGCNGGASLTSLNNRRVPPATSASGRATVSRLTLSRQNSLRAQSTTVVGAHLALRRVSAIVTGSRSPGSPGSVVGKPADVSVAASSVRTNSEATSTPHDDADDEDDDYVCLV